MTKESKMQLKRLSIFRGFGEETFNVSAEFEGEQRVVLDLGSEIGHKILELCVDEIVAAVSNVANIAMLRLKGDVAKELPSISPPLNKEDKEEVPF